MLVDRKTIKLFQTLQVLDVLAVVLAVPYLMDALKDLGGDIHLNNSIVALRSILKAFLPILYGVISDNYGRKKLFYLAAISLFIGSFMESFFLSITTFMFARSVVDLTRTTESAVNSVICDVVPSLDESRKIARQNTSLNALFFIVATVVGAVASKFSYELPARIALTISCVNLIITFMLPETLVHSPKHAKESKLDRFKNALNVLKSMWKDPNTKQLVFIQFYNGLVNGCAVQFIFDYSRVGLSLGTYGRVVMLIGAGAMMMLAMVTMPRVTKFYGSERNMLLVQTLFNAVNIGLLPLVTNEYLLYVSLFAHFFFTAGFLAITVELMKNVDHELHGSVQGVFSSITTLLGAMSPIYSSNVTLSIGTTESGRILSIGILLLAYSIYKWNYKPANNEKKND